MSDKIKAAVISGIFSLAVGVLTAFWGASNFYQNQNVIVNVNGEQVTVTPEKYQDLINENEALKKEINTYKVSGVSGDDAAETVTKNNKYLVYTLEPYSEKSYKKIVDEKMTMGGKKYNNGFSIGGAYSNGSAFYNLEGKYYTISGIMGYEDPGGKEDENIEFWGDDELITSILVRTKDLPKEFSVDVTGVKKFEIRTTGYILDPIDFAEVIIN